MKFNFFDKGQLGIYFGVDAISIAEVRGSSLLRVVKIPFTELNLSVGSIFSDEPTLVSGLRAQLKNRNVTARRVVVGLPSRELIMRSFELPAMPMQELNAAILSESRKFIPFKPEDIYFDFNCEFDKKHKKYLVLYVAVKKDIIERYSSLMRQLGLKIVAIEPAHFSLLRVIPLPGPQPPNAVIDADYHEANVSVVTERVLTFSRDLNMPPINQSLHESLVLDTSILVRFINEVRISLDYYRRQPSSLPLENIVYCSDERLSQWADTLSRELNLKVHNFPVNALKNFGHIDDVQAAKALSLGLYGAVKMYSSINFIGKISADRVASKKVTAQDVARRLNLRTLIRKNVRFALTLGVIFILSCGGYAFIKIAPLKKELEIKKEGLAHVEIPEPVDSLASLKAALTKYTDKSTAVKRQIDEWQGLLIAQLFEVLPEVMPEGLWISSLTLRQKPDGGRTLNLAGYVYLKDSEQEIDAVHVFVDTLKQHELFGRLFHGAENLKITGAQQGNFSMTSFTLAF